MSLEQALADNTAALDANTAVLKQIVANQQAALSGKSTPAKEATESTGRASRRERGGSTEATDTTKKEDSAGETRRDRRNRDAGESTDKAAKDAAETGGEGRRGRRERGAADDKKAEKPKKLTIDDVRAAGANFLDVTSFPKAKQEKEEDDRRGFLEAMLEELALDKLTEAKADDFEQIIDWLKRFADGEDVRFPGEGQ